MSFGPPPRTASERVMQNWKLAKLEADLSKTRGKTRLHTWGSNLRRAGHDERGVHGYTGGLPYLDEGGGGGEGAFAASGGGRRRRKVSYDAGGHREQLRDVCQLALDLSSLDDLSVGELRDAIADMERQSHALVGAIVAHAARDAATPDCSGASGASGDDGDKRETLLKMASDADLCVSPYRVLRRQPSEAGGDQAFSPQGRSVSGGHRPTPPPSGGGGARATPRSGRHLRRQGSGSQGGGGSARRSGRRHHHHGHRSGDRDGGSSRRHHSHGHGHRSSGGGSDKKRHRRRRNSKNKVQFADDVGGGGGDDDGGYAADVDVDEHARAAAIQARVRGHQLRKQRRKEVDAATKVQAGMRGRIARRERREQVDAATRVQAHIRGHRDRRERRRSMDAATRVQSRYRGHKRRREHREQKRAAGVIQKQPVLQSPQKRPPFDLLERAALQISQPRSRMLTLAGRSACSLDRIRGRVARSRHAKQHETVVAISLPWEKLAGIIQHWGQASKYARK